MAQILLTNDDGYRARGLTALAESLDGLGELLTIAPNRECSGIGHSISLHGPVRTDEVRPHFHIVEGTPVDCVNIGLAYHLEGQHPDLVVAGINHGVNLGDDVIYSGTVAAAREAAIFHLPALAVSQAVEREDDFAAAGRIARRIAAWVLEHGLPDGTFLSVNIPAGPIRGVRLTSQDRRVYRDVLEERTDPRGRRYFWLAGQPHWERRPGADFPAVAEGCVAITPLHLDTTAPNSRDALAALAAACGDLALAGD